MIVKNNIIAVKTIWCFAIMVILICCKPPPSGLKRENSLGAEDYLVYSGLISNFFAAEISEGKNKFILYDSTIKATGILNVEFRNVLPDSITVKMYLQNLKYNKIKIKIDETKFSKNIKMLLLSMIKNTVKSKNNDIEMFWKDVYSLQPSLVAVIGLSRVSYNKEKSYAIVDMEYFRGSMWGGGYSFIMKKEAKQWKILYKYLLSAS